MNKVIVLLLIASSFSLYSTENTSEKQKDSKPIDNPFEWSENPKDNAEILFDIEVPNSLNQSMCFEHFEEYKVEPKQQTNKNTNNNLNESFWIDKFEIEDDIYEEINRDEDLTPPILDFNKNKNKKHRKKTQNK